MLAGQVDELKEDLTCVKILKVRHLLYDDLADAISSLCGFAR